MYFYPPLQQKNYPTIAEIKTIIQQAESPNESERDQRPLMAVLSRMATSPRIQGLINTRKIALTGYKWNITGADEKKAKEIELRLKKTINTIIPKTVHAHLYGAFIIMLGWELKEDGKFAPVIKKDFPPVEVGLTVENEIYKAVTKNNKLLKESIDNFTGEYIFGTGSLDIVGGVLRSIIYFEFLKDQTIQEWWNYNKKLKGLIQAKADNGQKEDAATALNSFVTNGYSITDKDVEFLVNDLTSAKSLESFRLFIDMLNTDISIAILGQANINDLPDNGGSRAAIQVQELIRKDILYSDMLFAKKIINEQILLYDYKKNVDKNAIESPFEFDFIVDDISDLDVQARVLEIAIQNGIPLKKDEVYKNLGLTAPTADDEILEVKSAGNYNI